MNKEPNKDDLYSVAKKLEDEYMNDKNSDEYYKLVSRGAIWKLRDRFASLLERERKQLVKKFKQISIPINLNRELKLSAQIKLIDRLAGALLDKKDNSRSSIGEKQPKILDKPKGVAVTTPSK